jgi:tetratricopeptide (TPR) repeat protein
MTNSSTAPNFDEVVRLAEKAMKFWQAGENHQSSEVLKELVNLDPYSALWPTLLARTKLLEGETKEALNVADEALNIRGIRQADLFLLRAQANLKLDASTTGSQTARNDLLSARALGVLNFRAANELAEALATLGLSPQNEQRPSPSVVVETPKVQEAPKAVAPKVVTPSSEPKNANAALAQALEAREAELKGHYLKARGHCAEALKLSAHLPEAVLCLARIHLQNREASAVGKLFKAHPSVLQRGAASYIQAMSLKAAAAEQEGDWDTACEELEAVTKVAQQEEAQKEAQSAVKGSSKDESKATATRPGWAPQPKLEDLMGRLARARWRSGEKQSAINLAQSMLELAPNQRQACEVACAILLERGESGTALALMVRCLIANRHDGTAANADFVIGVMRHCSVEELSHVLAPKEEDLSKEQSTSIAEVIGYIGLILKERGESLESCRLYRKAVVLAPDHGSLCLNLMHAFSIRRDDLRALA